MKKIASLFCGAIALVLPPPGNLAQTADQAWLKYSGSHGHISIPPKVRALGSALLEQTAAQELQRGINGYTSGSVLRRASAIQGETVVGTLEEVRRSYPSLTIPTDLGAEGYWLHWVGDSLDRPAALIVAGADQRGVLYGAFALLRQFGTFKAHLDQRSSPAMPIRWVNEWDNADGSVERGYAGRSIFFEGGKVRDDLKPVAEYARLLASVGINACNVNNVNNASAFLEPEMIAELKRIADTMRPWGVRLAMSVDVASPQKIGGLKTYDPLDPAVKAWWKATVDAVYAQIPDLAGLTVKADSEGQPGPASFGRTPADAANTLAEALAPHGGVVLYRAFVYNHHLDWNDPKADRARAAYDIFHPLDGKFLPNVIVQIKEGPIDFQVREPLSPLFAGLPHTATAMEVQITQEYLGQQRHLVFLGPKWEWDLNQKSNLAHAARDAQPADNAKGLTGMIGVACVGRDALLGSPLAMANLYAFGRLAWNPKLTSEEIAREWTLLTFLAYPGASLKEPDIDTVIKMLLQSWPAYEHYTGPLGLQTLTDISASHYGPGIEGSENNGWGQWHRADREGVGMDRTVATGTGYAGQYPPEIANIYEHTATTPDDLLLFFHHVPYTYKLQNRKTVIQYLYDSHYEGAATAASFVSDWQSLKGKIDPALYDNMLPRLEYQAGHAIVWRDAVVQYFSKLSGIPDEQGRAGNFPGRIEAENARLTGYQIIDVKPWEDASRGKAVTCAIPAEGPAQPKCTAEWTYSGSAGTYDVAIQYFDLQGGAAKFAFNVNGKPAAAGAEWSADATLPTPRPHGDNSTRRVLHDIPLKPGDTIRITGTPDGKDPAAFDYIEVTPTTP